MSRRLVLAKILVPQCHVGTIKIDIVAAGFMHCFLQMELLFFSLHQLLFCVPSKHVVFINKEALWFDLQLWPLPYKNVISFKALEPIARELKTVSKVLCFYPAPPQSGCVKPSSVVYWPSGGVSLMECYVLYVANFLCNSPEQFFSSSFFRNPNCFLNLAD